MKSEIQILFKFRYHKFGLLIFFVHDVTDILLEFTKCNVYLKKRNRRTYDFHEYLSNIGFVAFAISWLNTFFYILKKFSFLFNLKFLFLGFCFVCIGSHLKSCMCQVLELWRHTNAELVYMDSLTIFFILFFVWTFTGFM